MRVLFVHEVNYSNKVIFEMHEFPELLALKGHSVTFFHFPEAPDHPTRSLHTRRETINGRVYPNARIDLVTPPTVGGSVFERYVAPIWNLPSLRAEIASGRYDVIVLYAVPTSGWQTVALARRHGVPVVFRALDVSHQIRRSPLSPLVRAAEKYIYRNAALLSGNNPAMVEYCVEISGRTGPTRVNLPPIDLEHFEQAQHHVRREDLGIAPDDHVVLYMGSFFTFSGLDIAIEGFAEQFRIHPDLKLVLVGGGDLDDELRHLVTKLGLEDRVVFTGIVPYAELPGYLHIADVAINPFMPQLLTDVALPHKILQYMAAGVATVSTSLAGIRGILGDESGVMWVGTPSEVARAATEIAYLEPEVRAAIAARQRAFVKATFAKDASVASFEDALQAVG